MAYFTQISRTFRTMSIKHVLRKHMHSFQRFTCTSSTRLRRIEYTSPKTCARIPNILGVAEFKSKWTQIPQTLTGSHSQCVSSSSIAVTPIVFRRWRRQGKRLSSATASVRCDKLHAMGGTYHAQGKYQKALDAFQKALTIRDASVGRQHSDTARTLNNIGVMQSALGQRADAIETFTEALRVAEALRKQRQSNDANDTAVEGDRILGAIAHNLASEYDLDGRFEDACTHYRRATEIRCMLVYEDAALDDAASRNNLGGVLRKLGQLEEALSLCHDALHIRQRLLRAAHPDCIATLNNVASITMMLGDQEEADRLFEEALGLNREAVGENHPSTASIIANMASSHETAGDISTAIELYERAISICEHASSIGRQHGDTMRIIHRLALVLAKNDDYERALRLIGEAVQFHITELGGEEHEVVADILHDTATLCFQSKRYSKAVELYEKVLNIRAEMLGKDHPKSIQTLLVVASMQQALGEHDQALKFFRNALELLESAESCDEAVVSQTLCSIADLLVGSKGDLHEATGMYERAYNIRSDVLGPTHTLTMDAMYQWASLSNDIDVFDKCIEMKRRELGENHVDTARTFLGKGLSLGMLGRYNEAVESFAQGHNILKKVLGEDDPAVIDAGNTLRDLMLKATSPE
jgi:tetratricopeptide (TPR) repeat protein